MPFPVNVHSLKQNPGQGGPHVNVDTWMQITLWKALFQAYSSSIAQDCGVLHVPLSLSHSLLWLTAPHGSSFEMSCQPQCYQSESEHFHSLYVNWGTQTPLNFSAGGCYSWSTRYFWGSSSNQRSTVSFFRERLFLTYHVTVLEVSHMSSKHTVKWHYYYSMNRTAVSLKLLSSEKGS